MPKEQEDFQNAVTRILEVVIFENWLRFYFIVEEKAGDGAEILRLELPEKSVKKISELYPDLLPLAEQMNHRPVDFETSRTAVLTYVLNYLDGKSLSRGVAQMVFASATFQIKLQLFHAWIQAHESVLDAHFLDFGNWLDRFDKWQKEDVARELARRLGEPNPEKAESERK